MAATLFLCCPTKFHPPSSAKLVANNIIAASYWVASNPNKGIAGNAAGKMASAGGIGAGVGFKKPRDHEQFITFVCTAKLVTTNEVLDSDLWYPNHQMLFLKNSVHEEPIKTMDTKP
ncbi:hypothetical protein L2E82_12071 [Cichorium intybus]|uniref:Uncharacterized protein n=1 Tax=Cichorium intybus TaxID=13427 RepID=A0ACB9GEU5_CICIN|nr:hypothetical protein L2E82_12071 [Cichorium intybus]